MRARLLGLLALAACSPYDPSLPATPFLCATSAPLCPDGYTCVADGTRMVCSTGGSALPDAGMVCTDDSTFEGTTQNDTIQTAYVTTVAGVQRTLTLAAAICPGGDKDTYGVQITAAMQRLDAAVTWATGQPVNVDILDGAGMVLASGTASGDRGLTASATGLAIGMVYIQTSAAPGIQNNYSLAITVSGP